MELKKTIDDRIVRALQSTWAAIGSDYLIGEGEECTRDQAVEATLDCGHLEAFGGDREAAAAVRGMALRDLEPLIRRAFPCDVYCV